MNLVKQIRDAASKMVETNREVFEKHVIKVAPDNALIEKIKTTESVQNASVAVAGSGLVLLAGMAVAKTGAEAAAAYGTVGVAGATVLAAPAVVLAIAGTAAITAIGAKLYRDYLNTLESAESLSYDERERVSAAVSNEETADAPYRKPNFQEYATATKAVLAANTAHFSGQIRDGVFLGFQNVKQNIWSVLKDTFSPNGNKMDYSIGTRPEASFVASDIEAVDPVVKQSTPTKGLFSSIRAKAEEIIPTYSESFESWQSNGKDQFLNAGKLGEGLFAQFSSGSNQYAMRAAEAVGIEAKLKYLAETNPEGRDLSIRAYANAAKVLLMEKLQSLKNATRPAFEIDRSNVRRELTGEKVELKDIFNAITEKLTGKPVHLSSPLESQEPTDQMPVSRQYTAEMRRPVGEKIESVKILSEKLRSVLDRVAQKLPFIEAVKTRAESRIPTVQDNLDKFVAQLNVHDQDKIRNQIAEFLNNGEIGLNNRVAGKVRFGDYVKATIQIASESIKRVVLSTVQGVKQGTKDFFKTESDPSLRRELTGAKVTLGDILPEFAKTPESTEPQKAEMRQLSGEKITVRDMVSSAMRAAGEKLVASAEKLEEPKLFMPSVSKEERLSQLQQDQNQPRM